MSAGWVGADGRYMPTLEEDQARTEHNSECEPWPCGNDDCPCECHYRVLESPVHGKDQP